MAMEVTDFNIVISYSTELFEAVTVQRMLHSYVHLLQQLVQTPESPVGSAALLYSCDKQQLLAWGAGEKHFDNLRAPLVHQAFTAAAVANPDNCCLVFEGNSLSYGAVKCQADELAGRLQAAGVGPGVAVGVLLERSLELPIAVLAVFMAGGCYVPLDPSYPEQRLQGYLEESQAMLLVSHSSLNEMKEKLLAGTDVQVGGSCVPTP
jgi:non-ribosomal peptide synthetase component F